MKISKKTLFSLLIASAMGVASVAHAELDKGRITYQPAEAIDMVSGKVKLALDAVTSGADSESVSKLIKDALDSSKEINANDKVDMARSRANNKLKSARNHLKESTQESEQELRDAYRGFQDLKGLL